MGRVAVFVSPHGFGHAARACAVMAEIQRRCRTIHFEVFTEVPRWFFAASLPDAFTYHGLETDVGLVQHSPLVEDLQATVARLDQMLVDLPDICESVAADLRRLGCELVIADISPLGLAVAAHADVAAVLVENFTWDWIYTNFAEAPSKLRHLGRRLAEVSSTADLRIQTEPVCEPRAGAASVPPVARVPRLSRAQVRARLAVPDDDPMIVVSMGGVAWDYTRLVAVKQRGGAWVVVPGGSEDKARRRGRMILLPFQADVYHPDLVAASDLVVGKLGYSTVAETYRAGAAFVYVGRPRFPESPVLARWVEDHLAAVEIEADALRNGAWLHEAEELLRAPRRRPDLPNGAVQAAEVIAERFPFIVD
jgi:UDP:flavonoid glycosyltransferase YjiC (YdhE family)